MGFDVSSNAMDNVQLYWSDSLCRIDFCRTGSKAQVIRQLGSKYDDANRPIVGAQFNNGWLTGQKDGSY